MTELSSSIETGYPAEFDRIPVATISDALDKLGLRGTSPGLLPLVDGARMVGRAYTGRYVPVQYSGVTVGDYLDEVQPGQVVVLDNNGRLDCTVWGALMTVAADVGGIAGTVVNGVCRDTREVLDREYPMFTRGRHMATGKDRVGLVEVQVPVDLGGVQVAPGDLVAGDDDGVVVVPREWETEVLKAAIEIHARELAMAADIEGGATLAETRERHGYYLLQRGQG